MKRKALFDDDEEEGKEMQLKTNQEFAKKYEAKKKREELAICLFHSLCIDLKDF